jgi:threonine dehydrogenase-like Zn-dependent dehydrogenase
MKILQITAPGEHVIRDIPTPQPGPGEVLMRVEAVSTCPQWDLHLRRNDPMFPGSSFSYPYTPGQPGHEATGTIAEVGPGVDDFSVGDRVSAWKDPGHHRWGCYAQYAVLSREHVIKVSKHLTYEETAPIELAMCLGSTILMLKEMNVLAGRRVGIMGLGPAGLVAAQMAKAEGAAEVIGFDLLPARREFALRLGVDKALDPRDDSKEFPARPQRPALETSIDCVGAKASVEFIMDRTADVVALFGVQREDYTFAPRHYGGLRLCGYKGHHFAAAQYAARLVEDGALRLAPLCTHHLPLERYGEGIELLAAQQAIKVCFWPWKQP